MSDAIYVDTVELAAALDALPREPTELEVGERLRVVAALHRAAPEVLLERLLGSDVEPITDEAGEFVGLRCVSTQKEVITREELARLTALPPPPPRPRVLRPGDGWYDA